MDLLSWQAKGHDVGTTAAAWPQACACSACCATSRQRHVTQAQDPDVLEAVEQLLKQAGRLPLL